MQSPWLQGTGSRVHVMHSGGAAGLHGHRVCLSSVHLLAHVHVKRYVHSSMFKYARVFAYVYIHMCVLCVVL